MAATYDLLADHGSADELITQVPYWVLGIARFAKPVTWNPETRESFVALSEDPVAERDILVITGDAAQVTVTTAKDAHVASMNALLAPGLPYANLIMPGDWIVCCMVNSQAHGLELAERMRNGLPINQWNDGLKLLGRVKGCRKRKMKVEQTGTPQQYYTLSAVGFSEFDSDLFYHPQLQKNQIVPAALREFGLLINDIVRGSSLEDGGAIDINKILPKLCQTIFGRGAYKDALGTPATNTSGPLQPSPNESFLVPPTVSAWLGLEGAKTFSSVLRIQVGLQHYRTVDGVTSDTTTEPWRMFQPDGVHDAGGWQKTPSPLIGAFPLAPPPTNTTVWNMLSSYMNEPVNEMYVALRADAVGRVLPHFIARQTPYSSRQVARKLAGLNVDDMVRESVFAPQTNLVQPAHDVEVTEFLELPRWQASDPVVWDFEVGRSDAMRFNYVHVTGTGPGVLSDYVGNFVRSPPVKDEVDIKRNGLRPYIAQVNCLIKDVRQGPQKWRDIIADIVMGQHLMLSGRAILVGVQAPIAAGDNFEYDGVVFHIESVTHACSINPQTGDRTFRTVLALSHGVETEAGTAANTEQGQNEREAHFAGVAEGDDMTSSFSVTVEE